jgi:imidazolonepropionase-like amidohydrolase
MPAGEGNPGSGTQIVEGNGRYLVPGLVDFHIHLRDESELLSYLRYGVTTVVNMRGFPDHLALAESVASGTIVGPWIVTAGPLIDGDPPIWSGSGTVVATTPEEARRAVAAQAAAGYDFIKTYNNLTPQALRAAIEEARAHGLAVVGHLPRNPDRATALQKALDAGLAMIPHAEEIFFTYLGGSGDAGMTGAPPAADPARIRAAARLVAEAGAAVTPNLSFVAMTARMLEDLDAVLGHPESGYLSTDVLAMWREQNPTRRDDLERFAAREVVKRQAVEALTLELQRAGVPLLLGTDASAPGMYPGESAILELEELVRAGLTPFEALTAGTRTAGEFLARRVPASRPIGTMAPGKSADLVLVDGNPLEDVSRMRDPAGIVLRGQWLPREELESLRR